jgi:hypothetical protein
MYGVSYPPVRKGVLVKKEKRKWHLIIIYKLLSVEASAIYKAFIDFEVDKSNGSPMGTCLMVVGLNPVI